MARVPAVTAIAKDTPRPGVEADDECPLDLTYELPEDFDWDAVPDDDGPMPYSDDEDATPNGHSNPSAYKPEPPTQPPSEPPPSGLPPSMPPAPSHAPRSDGVVADPMGVAGLEEGEIEPKKWHKKKKKRKGGAEEIRCELCNIVVNGQKTMESHLRGQRHLANERQAALKERNKALSDHGRAILAQNSQNTSAERQHPDDAWDAPDATTKPTDRGPTPSASSAPSPSADHRNMARRMEERPRERDPYAMDDPDRRGDGARIDHSSRAADQRLRDQMLQSRDPQLHRSEGGKRDIGTETPRQRDPYTEPRLQQRNQSRAPGISAKDQNSDPSTTQNGSPAPRENGCPTTMQNGVPLPHDTDVEPKKRKRSDNDAGPDSAPDDRRLPNKAQDRPRDYEPVGDGALRRKLGDSAVDPGRGDVGRIDPGGGDLGRGDPGRGDPGRGDPGRGDPGRGDPGRGDLSRENPEREDPVRRGSDTDRGSSRLREPGQSESREDQPPDDQSRRFTYGSVRREAQDHASTKIPSDWLSVPMETNEWRDLRHTTFTKGDNVDRLAFKMLQEILLSPVLGVSLNSLTPFSRAMLEAVKNQYLTKDGEVLTRFDDFPQALLVRDQNHTRGDPEWHKSQTEEQMAVRLVSDNIVFCLHSYEDNEKASSTEPHNFPRRGSFGQKNMTKSSSRDGGRAPRYEDSVEQDTLFNELYDHLLRQRLGF